MTCCFIDDNTGKVFDSERGSLRDVRRVIEDALNNWGLDSDIDSGIYCPMCGKKMPEPEDEDDE